MVIVGQFNVRYKINHNERKTNNIEVLNNNTDIFIVGILIHYFTKMDYVTTNQCKSEEQNLTEIGVGFRKA